MNVDGKPRLAQFWKDQNHGTPEKPNPVNDFPERREKKDKKWHKALMVLDKDLKATCVSPETMAASGKSYAEDIAPKVYHHVTDVVKLSHKKPIKDLNGEELSEEKIWGDMIACAQYGGDDEDRCEAPNPRDTLCPRTKRFPPTCADSRRIPATTPHPPPACPSGSKRTLRTSGRISTTDLTAFGCRRWPSPRRRCAASLLDSLVSVPSSASAPARWASLAACRTRAVLAPATCP